MNIKLTINLSLMFLINGLHITSTHTLKHTVVTTEPPEFLHALYNRVRTQVRPAEGDHATTDANARLRICEDINDSGLSLANKMKYKMTAAGVREIYANLKKPEYSDIFHFVSADSLAQKQYSGAYYPNPYRLRELKFDNFVIDDEFRVNRQSVNVEEYVFLCFLRTTSTDNVIFPYYVSKSYNLRHEQRFIFVEPQPYNGHWLVFLAEKASQAYVRPDFNVELHYLELRKHHKQTAFFRLDAVCKLNAEKINLDESFRLCTAVLGSSYDQQHIELRYPRRAPNSVVACYEKRVSFRTAEALEKVRGNTAKYQEWMIRCVARVNGKFDWYFISRAYNPHEVFVYEEDPANDYNIYLKTMVTDVNFVYEPYNFGNVEI